MFPLKVARTQSPPDTSNVQVVGFSVKDGDGEGHWAKTTGRARPSPCYALSKQCLCRVVQDVPVDSLVPAALQDWQPPAGANTADAFIKEMQAYDADKAAQIKAAVDKARFPSFVRNSVRHPAVL